MSSGKSWRVGLVGAGHVAEHHIRALKRIPAVEIVGVTDLDGDRARDLVQRHGAGRAFESLEDLVAAGAEVVHVLTPPDGHAAVALRAFELGCHALIEKPLAVSVEECDRLIEAAAHHGRYAGVNHSLLGDPQLRYALDRARGGHLGELTGFDVVCSSEYPPYAGGPMTPPYREGGYPFRDLGVHALYCISAFLGPIRGVDVDFRSRGADPNLLYDDWTASVDAEKGRGHIRLSWCSRPLQFYMRAHGTRGSVHADLAYMFTTARRVFPGPEAAGRIANVLGEALPAVSGMTMNVARFAIGRLQPYQPLHNLVADFYANLTAGLPPPATLADGREAVRWTEEGARPADLAKKEFIAPFEPRAQGAILVTGANGFLGRRLVRRLLETEPHRTLRLFVRRPPRAVLLDDPRIEVVLGDLGDPGAVDRAVRDCPEVFHVGAALDGDWARHESGTVRGTQNVVDACLAHGVSKLVYVSSLSVIAGADLSGGPLVTEDSPLEPRAQERGFYSQAKLAAERIVTEAARTRGLRAVVLRPGQLFGADAPMTSVTGAMKVGSRLLVLGSGSIVLPLVYVDDVVDGLLLAWKEGRFDGRVYQFVDDAKVTQIDLTRRVAAELKLRVSRMPQPVVVSLAWGVGLLGRILRRRVPLTPYRLRSGQADLRFDCSRARSELGWVPAVGVAEGLNRTLAGLREGDPSVAGVEVAAS